MAHFIRRAVFISMLFAGCAVLSLQSGRAISATPTIDASSGLGPVPSEGEFANLVGPEGGQISTSDGKITVTVPAGAVSGPAMVQVATELPGGSASDGFVLDLSVNGLRDKSITSFSKPVSVDLASPTAPNGVSGSLTVRDLATDSAVFYELITPAKNAVHIPEIAAGRYSLSYEKPAPAPQSFSGDVPIAGGVVQAANTDVVLSVPKGASDNPLHIQYQAIPKTGINDLHVLRQFELSATATATGAKVSSFSAPITITLRHSSDQLGGLNPDGTTLYWFDDAKRD